MNYPEIDLGKCENLLYKLVKQAREHFEKTYDKKDVTNIFYYHKNEIGKEIYSQMINDKHFAVVDPKVEVKLVNPVMEIYLHKYSKYEKEEPVDYRETIHDGDIRKKIFTGFKKSCHNQYKFESKPEQIFSIVLEREDNNVIKWLRPADKQFKLWWTAGHMYKPDFVVETHDKIYMVEVKSKKEKETEEVKLKFRSARKYIDNINALNDGVQRKKWDYMFLIENEIHVNNDFEYFENLLHDYLYY